MDVVGVCILTAWCTEKSPSHTQMVATVLVIAESLVESSWYGTIRSISAWFTFFLRVSPVNFSSHVDEVRTADK